MGWVRDKLGGLIFEKDREFTPKVLPKQDEAILERARRAQEEFGFTDAERAEFERVQRAALADPRIVKKLVRRVRRFEKAKHMSPTIKSRPYKRSRRSK